MPEQNDQDNNKIDPKSFLLPKKEGPSLDSAQRINAGALLAEEQRAGAEGPAQEQPLQPSVPAPTEVKKDDTEVKPLQTYRGDMESLVESKNLSTVSIAAAEADKKRPPTMPAAEAPWWRTWMYWGGGVLLVVVAGGLASYVLTRPTTVPVVPLNTAAPFIAVDDTSVIRVVRRAQGTLMQDLNTARLAVSLPVGLIERLYVASVGTNAEGAEVVTELPAGELVALLSPFAPQTLARTLTGPYLLGVHSFADNQAFLILSTDSYETAYAGMLEWERTMRGDLLPLFERIPPVRATENTPGAASTSPATSTPIVVATGFVDRVVENRDTRVLQNSAGDIVLLWTFLTRNIIVVATNEFTLREIISRVTTAPNLGLPQ